MALIDSIVIRFIRFWQLFCIHLSSRTINFYFHILLYSSIDWFFTFYPQRLCDRIGWGIRSQFFPVGFLGFCIRQRTWIVKPEWLYLGIFVNHSLVMMLNFVCYLDGIKHSGSTVRAAHPFPSLSSEHTLLYLQTLLVTTIVRIQVFVTYDKPFYTWLLFWSAPALLYFLIS